MSSLEQQAIRVLTPAIKGDSCIWSALDQEILARWAAKTFVVLESLNKPRDIVSTQEERDNIRLS
jgi:hypothetical protein